MTALFAGFRRRLGAAVAGGIVLSLFAGAASAAKQVALVIGNGAYEHVDHLVNPPNDAEDVGSALDRLGFAVTRLPNAGFEEMRKGLRKFEEAAARSEVAVVFYAGHGIEMDDRNYLIPVDARLESDRAVKHEAIRLDRVLESVQDASRFRLVILDAFRNNPFVKSMKRRDPRRQINQGLRRVEPSGGTLVVYAAMHGATAADGEGRNSPYTQALLRYLEEPGLDVGKMFRRVRDAVKESTGGSQVPSMYGSLPGDSVYLSAPPFPEVLRAYQDGDYATAYRGFRVFANQGNAPAQSALGRMYLAGAGVPRDYAEAAEWFHKAADQDDVNAQSALGRMYFIGRGVPRDHVEAAEWSRKAADRDDAPAQYVLGAIYDVGKGVPQDYAEAVKWFRKAADQDNVNAQFSLGRMYRAGRGVPQDYAEAAEWFRKAADQDDAPAQFALGQMYRAGQGVPQDYVQAYKWWLIARDYRKRISGLEDSLDELEARMTQVDVRLAYRLAEEWYFRKLE